MSAAADRAGAVVAAALAAAAALAPGVAAAQRAQQTDAYLTELAGPSAEVVAVSNHFRHSVGCTSAGCVLMGPTDDRAACEEWTRAYNAFDPYDHARCVDAADYIDADY